MDNRRDDIATRHLNIDHSSPPIPRRGTGPLDYFVPWVIELRIIGTPDVLQVQLNESMMIGRGGKGSKTLPDIDLDIYDGYQMGISRQHAVISALNSRVSIRDLNSSNGTYLNGGKMQAGYEYRLRHGDRLAFGQLEVQVSFVLTPSSHEKNEIPYSDVMIPVIGSGQQVMVVEDDERLAFTMARVLEIAGFEVVIARSVTTAITLAERQMPNAILMELMLPDRSGLDLVEAVRLNKHGAKLPIIVVSGASGGYQMGKALEAGVDVFLNKPVGVDEIVTGFTKVLSQMSTS